MPEAPVDEDRHSTWPKNEIRLGASHSPMAAPPPQANRPHLASKFLLKRRPMAWYCRHRATTSQAALERA